MVSEILEKYFVFLFGGLKFLPLSLYQFFSYHLSRKAEGNGPMKP